VGRQLQLGLRIKALRDDRDLTQEQLAELIGKSVDTVSSIERGKSAPGFATAFDIAKALGVSYVDLFDWVERDKLTPQQKDQAVLVEKFRALIEGRSNPTMEDVVVLTEAISKAASKRAG